MLNTTGLVYDRNYDDFTLRYYLAKQSASNENTEPCTPKPDVFYGVIVEKQTGDAVHTEYEGALLSECEGDALKVLRMLYDMEVTPISFTEVIDAAVITFMADTT